MAAIKRRFMNLTRTVKVILISIILFFATLFGFIVVRQPVLFPTIPPVGAISITFESTTSDGYLRNSGTVYATVRTATTANYIASGNSTQVVGQQKVSTTYYIQRAFLYFDTSSLTTDAIIESAKIRLYGLDDFSTIDFNITVQNGQPTYPSDPLVLANYDMTFYSGNGGYYDTTNGWSTTSYNNITLNSDGRSWINKTGTTKLALHSSRDINAVEPTTTNERVTYCPAEYPVIKRPKLEITYTYPIRKILWVNSFDSTTTNGWYFIGSTPYLNNSTENYIRNSGVGNASWFKFQDTDLPSQQVLLFINWKITTSYGNEIKLYLHDGTNENYLGAFTGKFQPTWNEINVTSVLNTITKINNAKLKIESMISSANKIVVYMAYLRIYNGAKSDLPLPYLGIATKQTTISVKWYDPDGLSSYAFNHNASGSWLATNITGVLSGTTAWSNVTITMPTSTIKPVAIKFWTNDTLNNWENTFDDWLDYVYPVWEQYNQNKNQEIISGTLPTMLAHSYGRKTQYGVNTQRFWSVFANGTHHVLSSTINGTIWSTPVIIRSGSGGYFGYYWIENRSNNDYLHYAFCTEETGNSLYYRRAVLYSNGSFSWSTTEQTVISGASVLLYACSVLTDQNGYPYITYGNRTVIATREIKVIKSQFNNGTWNTASGFPKVYNADPDSTGVSGTGHQLPNNDIYLIYSTNDNTEPLKGRVLFSNGTLGSLESISSYNSTSNLYFNAVSTPEGNIGVIYRYSETRLDYSWRNYTSGVWQIKDELISNYVSDMSYSWGVIGCDPDTNVFYVNWWTLTDSSGWISVRNVTTWSERERILILDYNNYALFPDPNNISPFSHANRIVFSYVSRKASNGVYLAYNYLYCYLPTTLSVGWNNITVWEVDVGHTLGEINASIWSDGIEFTILSKWNGTYYTFRRGYSWNANIVILATTDRLFIYVTVAGNWEHNYP